MNSFNQIKRSRNKKKGRHCSRLANAKGGTRTPTPLRAQAPEACASANSATFARGHLFYTNRLSCQVDVALLRKGFGNLHRKKPHPLGFFVAGFFFLGACALGLPFLGGGGSELVCMKSSYSSFSTAATRSI